MFFDSHCHLTFKDYERDLADVVARMREKRTVALSCSAGKGDNGRLLELKKRFPEVLVALGTDPYTATEISGEELEEELNLAGKNLKKISAVGEIGLDRHHFKSEEDWKRQEIVFKEWLSFAETNDLAASIHARDAEKRVMELVKGRKCVRIFHCFLKPSLLQEALESAEFVSLPTIKSSSRVKIIEKCPFERLLCETDSPFLWKEGGKTARNEPSNVAEVYGEIVRVKGVSLCEAEERIFSSARGVFKGLRS